MSSDLDKEAVLQTRLRNLEMDLEMLENNQKRLEEGRAQIILKLISTRETLLSLQEQDE